MKVKGMHMGIHTIELYAGKLMYHQIQKVIDLLVEQKSIQQIFSDSYSIDRHLKSTYLVDQGRGRSASLSPCRPASLAA